MRNKVLGGMVCVLAVITMIVGIVYLKSGVSFADTTFKQTTISYNVAPMDGFGFVDIWLQAPLENTSLSYTLAAPSQYGTTAVLNYSGNMRYDLTMNIGGGAYQSYWFEAPFGAQLYYILVYPGQSGQYAALNFRVQFATAAPVSGLTWINDTINTSQGEVVGNMIEFSALGTTSLTSIPWGNTATINDHGTNAMVGTVPYSMRLQYGNAGFLHDYISDYSQRYIRYEEQVENSYNRGFEEGYNDGYGDGLSDAEGVDETIWSGAIYTIRTFGQALVDLGNLELAPNVKLSYFAIGIPCLLIIVNLIFKER